MVTYFVLYDPFSRLFVKQGSRAGWCSSINCAKHFTSQWNAEAHLRRLNGDELGGFVIKKIVRY